jgi:hypothetical protein
MFTMSFFIGIFIILTFVIALIIKGGSKIIDTKELELAFTTCVRWGMVISIVLTFASIFVSALFMSGNYDYLKTEVEEKTIYEIYALKDNCGF